MRVYPEITPDVERASELVEEAWRLFIKYVHEQSEEWKGELLDENRWEYNEMRRLLTDLATVANDLGAVVECAKEETK